jgi:hypothetical protein
MKITIIVSLLVLLAACGNGNERLKEKSEIESESQLRVENEGLAKKAEAMEIDLAKRHKFYQAVKGIYEGSIETNIGSFNIRITLTPSIAPIQTTRVRQLEEIASDLNNLTLNTQVVQWDPSNPYASVGCPGTSVKPDIENGEIVIPSSDACKNLYMIKITDREFIGSGLQNTEHARELSKQILRGDLRRIDSLVGSIQPSSTANIFKFVARKTEE